MIACYRIERGSDNNYALSPLNLSTPVVVEEMDAYNRFFDDFIFKLPGVSRVHSNIVLKEIKADTALPFR